MGRKMYFLSALLFALCFPLFCQGAEQQEDLLTIERNLSGQMLNYMDELEARLNDYRTATERLSSDAGNSSRATENLETQLNLLGRQLKDTLNYADSLSKQLDDRERKLRGCKKSLAVAVAMIILNRLAHAVLAIVYLKWKIRIPYGVLLLL